MAHHPRKRAKSTTHAQTPQHPNKFGMAIKRLARRAAVWLLRFLWRQVKWAIAITALAGGGCLIEIYLHRFWWVGSIMLFIALIVAFAWVLDFFGALHGGKYSDDSPREPLGRYIEEQRAWVEEDLNRGQQEDESK